MKYYVDSIKIEEFINNCNGYIEEMKTECRVMRDIINKTKWKGNAHDAASLKYSKIMDDVDKIPDVLSLYVKFMEIVVKNYGEGTEKLRKELQAVISKLEMEKMKNEL